MPIIPYLIGPMAKIYVGTYGSTDVLTEIMVPTTGTINVTETLPEQFAPGLQVTLQSGLHEIQATAVFYGADETVIKLVRGIDLADSVDGPPEFTNYSVLLLHPDENAKASFFIPRARVVHNMPLNFDKRQVTQIPVTFLWQDRNRYNDIFYMNDYDTLAAIMGSVSPI